MTRNRRDSPQTTGVLFALAERADEWSHGYELCARLGLKAGTMYPILIRLADRGHVETAWEQDAPRGRPPRHLYRLTRAGVERVAELRAELAAAEERTAAAARARGAAAGTAAHPAPPTAPVRRARPTAGPSLGSAPA